MKIEARLQELGIELPKPPQPLANYVRAVPSGNLIFLSGHGPYSDGETAVVGKLGKELTTEDGYLTARNVAIHCLASVRETLGNLDRVVRFVRLLGMVNCTPDFTDQPQVVNGASDLLVAVFGEAGRHARSAMGVNSLPNGMPVEIEMILEFQ